jgi:hypothetical protein
MGVSELVEQSAEVALKHAATLEKHLRSARGDDPAELEACRSEMHDLVGDIATLRNATVLLQLQLDRAPAPGSEQ